MGFIFMIIFIKNGMDVLDPIFIISIVYITMFTIVPMIDISTNNILWFGVDLFDYGIKGTIISVIGYISFCIGYTLSIKREYSRIDKKCEEEDSYYDREKIIITILIGWSICFILSLFYLIKGGGKSISYILTLGLIGDVDTSNTTSSLGLFSMFSYSIIPFCLMYSYYGKSKFIKYILLFLTISVQLIRGFRFIVIILILSYAFFYYIKQNKRPNIKSMILFFVFACIIIAVMGFYRNAVRSGQEVGWTEFSLLEEINYALFENFRIYKTYYGIIKAVPEMTSHLFGKQMIIYTIVMFIPRIIWSTKPYPPGDLAIQLGISYYAKEAGTAAPNIAEFYYEFGIVGVIIFMWIFGVFMKKMRKKYLINNTDVFGLMIYSIIIPTTFQLIIRGYTPSNFYLVVFLVLPIVFTKKISIVPK